MIALLDGDIYCFRSAFSAEEETEAWVACSRVDKMIEDTLFELDTNSCEVWLTGKNNFRYSVYPEYKANRLKTKRPKWEHEVKDYLKVHWDARVSKGCEADDMLGVRSVELRDNAIISTIDKDLLQIPGWHYNFVKKEKKYVTPEEGLRWFYYQLLVGDSADGIKGCPGIGPKKANKLLSDFPPELWFEAVRDLYSCDEAMEMNAACLHIWQKLGDVWKFPNA